MPRLVIFDVDGTLIDSQAGILAAMEEAFGALGRPAPPREAVLGIVGLSLPQAMAALAPDLAAGDHGRLVEGYKTSYGSQRRRGAGEAHAPFYPGALAALDRIEAAGHLLGIATGKGRRGLAHMLEAHGLAQRFATTQTADDAPSKPAPDMVLNCLAETGIEARDAVVIGDTEYDMAMARAAGVRALGVAWGYHGADRLARGGAEAVLHGFDALDAALGTLWGRA